jgi:hypothetical protein
MMIKEFLSFRIELVNPINENESDQFAREFVHSLGLKTNSGTWSGIDLDSPMINTFISRSKDLIGNGDAKFDGFCTLTQRLVDDSNVEWYELKAIKPLAIEDCDEITTCKADKMIPNLNIAHGGFYNVFVSEKFMNVVKENNLTGIDFVWVKDVGRFKANQWYIPVAINALGRGFDHPWFNPLTLKGSSSNQPIEPEFRCGTNNFNISQIKKNNVFDRELQHDIISLFDQDVLSIISFRRILRDYVPNTDFAFVWHSTDYERKRGDCGVFFQEKDMLCKQRGLCISRRAKEILIKSKLITESDLETIKVYDSIPDGIELLDGKSQLPSPFFSFTNIDFDDLKEKAEAEWVKFSLKQKPIKKITFNQALKCLLETKKIRPEDFNKAPSKNEINKVNVKLPSYWVEILEKSDGCYLNSECTLVPMREIEQFSQDRQGYSEEVYEDYAQNLIHIAHSMNGDWYSLEITTDAPTDSKVLRISHETCEPIEEWDTIAMFIFDMLTDYGND